MNFDSFRPLAFLMVGVLICGTVLRAQGGAPQTTNFASLDYFNEKCARCHGSYGSSYGPNLGKGKTDAELTKVVKDMCEGPAQAPISERDLQVLVAWHRALRDGRPFVASVRFDNGVLTGEASPGTSVSLTTTTGERANVPLNGHNWSAGLPEGVQLSRIHVESYGKATDLDPRTDPYAPK